MTLWAEWAPFSGIWPRWGSMSRGEVYALPTWEPATVGSARSSWPSPDTGCSITGHGSRGAAAANGHQSGQDLERKTEEWRTPDVPKTGGVRTRTTSRDAGHQVTIAEQTEQWQTPRTMGGGNKLDPATVARKGMDANGVKRTVDLANQVELWPTPNTRDAEETARHTTTTGVMHSGTTLVDAIRQWPTPASRDSRDPNARTRLERHDNLKGEQLPNFIEHHWRTPNTRDWHEQGPRAEHPQRQLYIADQVTSFPSSRPVPTILDGLPFSRRVRILRLLCRRLRSRLPSPYKLRKRIFRKRLSPSFEDWLMGLPVGWSSVDHAFSASEMQSYLSRQRQSLRCLLGDLGC